MSEQDYDDLDVLHEDVDLVEDDTDTEVLEEDDPDNVDELLSEPEPERKKPLSKGQRQFIDLRRRAQEAEDRARRAEEKADRASGAVDILSRQPQRNQAELDREEQERLESLSPAEQAKYLVNKERQQIQGAFAQQNYQFADRMDKADFKQLCRENPAVAEIAQEVEDRLAKLRRETGTSVEREIMADKILGERVRMKAVKNLDKQRARTEEKTRQHTARAPGARSDVAGERSSRRANMSPRERLEALEAKGINPFRTR